MMESQNLLEKIGFREVTIPQQKHYDGLPFPLVVNPGVERSAKEWSEIIRENKEDLKRLTTKYGAILFREFPLEDPTCFDEFSKGFGMTNFPYLGGPAPRRHIVGNVYTSNEAPPDKYMAFHHEMAYIAHVPDFVFFYCDIPAEEGGDTPVAMSWPIYRDMAEKEPEFVAKFEREGIIYTRVQPNADDSGSIISASWQSTYFTKDKEEAVMLAEKQQCECEWLENDCLRVTSKLPAFKTDPINGHNTWFNNALAYYLGYQNEWNDSTKTVMFGNKDSLPQRAMETLKNVMEDHAVDYCWQKGDAIIMDNDRVLHTRRQFKGQRRVLAALYRDTDRQ